MILLLHWFIPYKVEREKTSFQCKTKEFKSKASQGNQAKKAKTKAKGKEFLSTYNTILKKKKVKKTVKRKFVLHYPFWLSLVLDCNIVIEQLGMSGAGV